MSVRKNRYGQFHYGESYYYAPIPLNDVSAGNLKSGSIYSMRYNGVNFILQGSDAAGNATPGDVLSGKTFTNDEGNQTNK